MARNRKRAKERRARRPEAVIRPGVATARGSRGTTPDPIEHASPDVELAEAQLALGRPELPENGLSDEAVDPEPLPDIGVPGITGATPRVQTGSEAGLTVGETAPAVRRPGTPSRVITFVQGSWRELQRVQWPDRRQVMQATGVVIGFVIIAGMYLGLADLVASKLMNFILK